MRDMKNKAQAEAAKNIIMVCVTGQKSCDDLIARGLERAQGGGVVHVVHCVETGKKFLNSPLEADAIEYLFTAAQLAGAELSLIRSEDAEDALVDFAKQKKANIIVLGAAGRTNGRETFVMRLQRRLPDVEFDVVSSRAEV